MEQFGKYTLIRKIGTGGMAEVFLARTTVAQGLNKTLVIKKIHTAYARSRQFVAMFVDEAKIALGLNHPNIAQVFDFGAVADTYFLAMEHVEGIDLLRLLQDAARARQRLPYGVSAYIVQQLAKGLDYAHRKTDEFGEPLGIVHRDVSPQNILLSWDGSVKIVDFGIARARDVHEEEGVIKGKYAYMSPEQARGEPVDCRSDVFAAGIVLFELVCARPLFHGKGKEALEMVKSGSIPRPRDFAPELPEALERIILRALAFHRSDRFPTARDLQHELGKFQLVWGNKIGALIDSGSLAQTLAQLVPGERAAQPRLPAEGDSRRARTPAGDDDDREPSEPDGGEPSELHTPSGRSGRSAAAQLTALHRQAQPPVPATTPTLGPRSEPRRDARERKYVYVLEGVLRGLGALEHRLGAAGAAHLVDEFYKVARDVAFKHDAVLELPRPPGPGDAEPAHAAYPGFGPHAATTGTGHDTMLRVVVGLPVASEDDANRAIRLALALVDALDGIGSDVEPELRLALAVQRGIALVRRAPAGKRGELAEPALEIDEPTAMFAHKLARQARGAEILVGGRVFRAARADWTFEALAAIDLPDESPSGTSRPPLDDDTDPGVKRARVYRLRGPKERSQRLRERRNSGRLYGRDLELKALRDAWRDVLISRRKRQIVIVGDPGVGKRMLVRKFLEGIAPNEAVVIRTSARVGAAMTPYGVLTDLARDVLGLAEDAEPHEVERRLLRALPLIYPGEEDSREARTALATLGMLLGGRGAAPALANEVDPDARRQTLIQLLVRVEQRLESDKPLIMFAEDVHWADQDSQELFAALLRLRTPRPILGVMTSRPDPRVHQLAGELDIETVLLDELTDTARRDMVAERLVPGPDVDELIDQIAARCGGNAFFIQELLDTLVERGILVPDGEARDAQGRPGLLRWVKRDAPIHVPSTIEDLILSRIDGLPAAEREVVVHAAVLGRHISAAALSQLLARPVRLELDDLVRRGLLSPRPETDEYRFKNDMTMTVAYGLISPDSRVQMHRSVAARIAGAPAYRIGQDDALIARHLELAGDDVAAAERYLRAAGHAVEVAGNADAFRQLARALKLLPADDHERRFTAHRLREEILRRLARRPQQLRELHAMRKTAEQLGDAARLATAYSALAQFYLDVGKPPAALRAASPALQYARDAGDPLLEADVLRVRAAIDRLVGNAEDALRLVDQAIALCDRSASNTGRTASPILVTRAAILGERGATLWNMGRLEAAIESYAEALVIYRALGMARQEARALDSMGMVFAALGEYEEALAHYKSGLKIDQALGDRSHVARKLGNIGRCYSDLGDPERAESYLGKALKLAEQTGDLAAVAETAVSWGQTKLQRGQARAALDLFERGRTVATENRDRYQEVRALQYIALAHLALGNPPDAALDMARTATDWARKMPMLVGIIYGLTFQGLALSRLGRHDEAIACVDAAVAQLEGARPDGAEHVHRWRAEVLAAAGRTDDARAALERAEAEIASKAARLHDPALREIFLTSRTRTR